MILNMVKIIEMSIKQITLFYPLLPLVSLLYFYPKSLFIKILFFICLPMSIFLLVYFQITKKINIDKIRLPYRILFGFVNVILLFVIYPISTFYSFKFESFILGIFHIVILLITFFATPILIWIGKKGVKVNGMETLLKYWRILRKIGKNKRQKRKIKKMIK